MKVLRKLFGRKKKNGNSIMVLTPYKYKGMWVFDDENTGLVREAFVAGADDIIDVLVKDIKDAELGFNLVFSATEFPGYQIKVEWVRTEGGGNWYYSPELKQEGWLCPALFKYFKTAPKEIYAQVKGL